MAKNKIITSQGNVQFINSKGKTINMHPMHCYAVYEDDTVSFLFIYMKEYSGQAFFASQFEDLEVNGETYDNMDDLKDAINYAFAKAGAQARTEIVEELPEDPFTNTIYLLPKEHGEGYDEYIWNEDEGWQLIGDTDIEFERYLKIDDFNPYSAATKDYIDAVSGETVANHNDIVALSGAIDTEISARTDADAFISGAVDTVSADLVAESQRAISAETALGGRIDTVNGRVDAEQIARAQADNALSGAIDTLSSVKADKADAVASAEYVESSTTINFKNISGTVISSIDASDFVVDGMVEDVRIETISGVSYLVIDFNTESGVEDIQIPLTDIFDPDNYYDKTAIDNIVSGLNDSIDSKLAISDFNTYSGAVDTAIGGKLEISDFETYSGNVETALGNKFDASAITAYSTTVEVGNAIDAAVSGKADASDLAEDEAVWGQALNDLNSRINTISGDVLSSGDVQTQIDSSISGKQDASGMTAYTEVTAFTAHTSDTDIHVTTAQTAAWNAKSDFSGSYNDLTNKLSAGTNITIVDNVINATGGGGGSEYVAGTGIDIDSANTITAIYKGYLSYDNPQQSLSDYEGEFYIKAPWKDCEGVETGECIFFTAENTDEYQYYFSLNPITKQYSVTSYPSGKENDWENYFSIEFDDEIAMFKVTTLQRIAQVNDNACTRYFRIGSQYDDYSYKYSGTTEDAFDGVIDNFNNYVNSANLEAYDNHITLYVQYGGGVSSSYNVILDDLTAENGHIHTNVQIPIGVSGWTSIQFAGCNILANNPSNSTFRLSGDTSDLANFNKNDFDTSWTITIEGYGITQDSLAYDSNQAEFILYSSWFGEGSEFGEVTFNYDNVANTITIAYPDTVSIGSNQKVKISDVYNNNCAFGTGITKFEVFDEYKQPLVPYVKGKINTSDITSAVTSASTDVQVPSAKAVYDAIPSTTSAVTSASTAVVESGAVYSQLGGLKLMKITQSAYDALVQGGTVDANTLYIISD